MKTILILLLLSIPFGSCREGKETIDFTTLPETEFNATPFQLPGGVPDSLKQGTVMALLETTQSKEGLLYKHHLPDTANMVLTATENITDVHFIITTRQNMSQPLLALLQTKPAIVKSTPQTSLSLYFISDNKFEIAMNGFFALTGRFVKAAMK